MTKKLMRGLVPVMVLSAAAALFTGCGSKEAPADTTQAGGSKETEAAGSTAASENKETESKGSSSKDTLIIATANETPSVTTNLHNAVHAFPVVDDRVQLALKPDGGRCCRQDA